MTAVPLDGRPRSRPVRPAQPGARRPVQAPAQPIAWPQLPPARAGDPAKRVKVVVGVVVLGMTCVTGRLAYWQVYKASDIAALGRADRTAAIPLPASRGTITDRNGNVLASDVAAYDITIDPTLMTNAAVAAHTSLDDWAISLAGLIGKTPAAVRPLLDPSRSSPHYARLVRSLDPAATAQVRALKLPGVFEVASSARSYPGHDLAANVIGFTNADGDGAAGIELSLQKTLAGKAGSLTVETDRGGVEIPSGTSREVPAVQGTGVQLTIDRDIQWYAQQALQAQVTATKAAGGYVVVEDPRTGQVLALATEPTVDLTDIGASPADARGNAAVSNVYEPGSVNKVITAAAAIQENVVTPATVIDVPNSLLVKGRAEPIVDAENHGDEKLTFTGVLAQSSNIGTVETAQKVGNQKLYSYLTAFGLGSTTGSGLPGESGGILPNVATWNPSQASTIPFGQGMAVTALQVANVYATIADGGVRNTPTLVAGTTAADGTFTPATVKPGVRVVSQQTATTVSQMLEMVTSENGTAPQATIPGYRISGKTGTAQAITNGRYDGGYVSSFVGFAPADAPRLVVEVVLDHPQTDHFGGTVAAPVFRDVMGFALRSLKVPPTGTAAPDLPLTP